MKDAHCSDLSFFYAILYYELLSILYFTLLNSELRLGRLAGKQRSLALGMMLTCSDQGINPKTCEVQGRYSGGGCGSEAPPPTKKKSSNFC